MANEQTQQFWLAAPSRFASLSRTRARVTLALLIFFVAASLSALASPGPPPAHGGPQNRGEDQTDVLLYESIVAGVRHGGDYYTVTAQALRTGDYPLKPFVTFRLPTLAMVQAHIPPVMIGGLLYLLAAITLLAWYWRLRDAFARPPAVLIALILLGGGMVGFVQPDLAAFHEVWAGLLVALSLALRRPGDWVASVAIGLAAMLVRETVGLYAGIMLVMAFHDGARREAAAWLGAILVLGVTVALHAHAVAQVVRPLDPSSPGWSGMLGFGFFLKSLAITTPLMLAPLWLAAPLAALALFGWGTWRDPLALRVLATLTGYALAIGAFARADTFYWIVLVAPLLLPGLAFVPDGLRDLWRRARDRRRITVTRSAA